MRTVESIEDVLPRAADLLELTHDAVMVLEPDGTIVFWNRGAERLYGWSREEASGKNVHRLLQSRFSGALETTKAALQCEGRWDGEIVQTARNGTKLNIAITWVPLCDKEGKLSAILEINNDITANRQREQQLRVLADAVPQLVWITGPDGGVTFVNQRWVEYTGQPPEEAYGSNWQAFIHPDDRPTAVRQWQESSQTGRRYEVQYRLRRADGEYCWFVARGLPVRDTDGQITSWFGTCTDVSDLRQAEETIRQLSTPILPVGPGLLVAPLIGRLYQQRAQQLTERLLKAIREQRARAVIVDLTGVMNVDTHVANHLIRTAQTVRLLGAEFIVSGISRTVAQKLTEMGVRLGDMRTVADLQSALEEARRVLSQPAA